MEIFSNPKLNTVNSRVSMASLRSAFKKKEPQEAPAVPRKHINFKTESELPGGSDFRRMIEPEFPGATESRRITTTLTTIMDKHCSNDPEKEDIAKRALLLAQTLIKHTQEEEESISHAQLRNSFVWAVGRLRENMEKRLRNWESHADLIELKEKWTVGEDLFEKATQFYDELVDEIVSDKALRHCSMIGILR